MSRFRDGPDGKPRRIRDGAIISSLDKDPLKRLRILNLDEIDDHTSLYEGIVAAVVEAGWANRAEVVSELALNVNGEMEEMEKAVQAATLAKEKPPVPAPGAMRPFVGTPRADAFEQAVLDDLQQKGLLRSEAQLLREPRGNFRYHKPTEWQTAQIGGVRVKCAELHRLLEQLPQNRETALAITKLEEVSMWANKAAVLGE
jgi:hypothetical protein